MRLKSRRLISHFSRSPLAYILLALLLGLFIWSTFGAYGKTRLAKKKVKEARTQLASLEEQKEKLNYQLESVETSYGEEKALREKFNVAREGEKVIMILPENNTANSAEILEKEGGFFAFIKKIFRK